VAVDVVVLIAAVIGICTFVIVAVFIGAGAVDANCHDNVTVLPAVPGFVTFTVALKPLMVAVKPVGNVNPPFAVSVTLAVYCWLPVNGLLPGAHVTEPTVKLPVPAATLSGATPVAGAVTVIAAVGMGVTSGSQFATISTAPCCGIVKLAPVGLVGFAIVTPDVVVVQLTKVWSALVPAFSTTADPLACCPEAVCPETAPGGLLVMLSCRWAGMTVIVTVGVADAPPKALLVADSTTLIL